MGWIILVFVRYNCFGGSSSQAREFHRTMRQVAAILRRPFRFSLRTLFLVVLLICVLLGWQLHIVRERRAMRKWVEDNGGMVDTSQETRELWRSLEEGSKFDVLDTGIPFLRKLLGDEAISAIGPPCSVTVEEELKLKKLFPEAAVLARPQPCE
jgi:hypothetical protein